MDSQYVDQYIRRKKGTIFLGQAAGERLQQAVRNAATTMRQAETQPQSTTTGSHLNRSEPPPSQQIPPVFANVDTTMNLISQVQNFVDRTDALNLQIVAAEDKMINLTRLMKMLQHTADEREEGRRREIADLRQHIARLEDQNAMLTESVSAGNIAAIARAVIAEELAAFRQESETTWNVRKQRELPEPPTSLTDRQVEIVRRMIEDNAKLIQFTTRDTVLHEVRTDFRRLEETIFPRAAGDDLVKRLSGFEEHSASIESSLTDFIQAFKEHSRQHAAKSEDTANALRELSALQEETRKAVATEIEGTKQWAVRNLQRIKKHLDINHADIEALREAHTASVEHVAVLQRAQSDEHERLCAMLEQKSKEAESLGDIIDKEIVGIKRLAQEHRTGVDETTAELQGSLAARSRARSDRLQALSRDLGLKAGRTLGSLHTASTGGIRQKTVSRDDEDDELKLA